MSVEKQPSEDLEAALQTLSKTGAIAWSNVASATAWVEALRGNTSMPSESDVPSGRIFGRPESD